MSLRNQVLRAPNEKFYVREWLNRAESGRLILSRRDLTDVLWNLFRCFSE
jgi:hypothetical protein